MYARFREECMKHIQNNVFYKLHLITEISQAKSTNKNWHELLRKRKSHNAIMLGNLNTND